MPISRPKSSIPSASASISFPNAGDARVVGHGNAVAFGLLVHGAELADTERFALFPDAPLEKKNRPFRVDFDEHSEYEQQWTEYNQSDERHDAVEAPLETESYVVFTFRHAAWPPY